MGRKTKTKQQKKAGTSGGSGATKISNKTANKIFKVGSEKSKSKKPKPVQGKLKKNHPVNKICEKVEAAMKMLHEQLVLAKSNGQPKGCVKKAKAEATVTTNQVAMELDNLKFK